MRRLSSGNISVAVDTGIGAGDGIVVGAEDVTGTKAGRVLVGKGGGLAMVVGMRIGALVGVGNC